MVAPRTRPLLVAIPFIMVARVAVLAHFVSDVFGGLALTGLIAWACAPISERISKEKQMLRKLKRQRVG